MEKMRFGVVGLGRIGWSTHCQKIAPHKDCTLAAVVDTDSARRREAEETFGCKAFADYNEMLASGLVDAVVIATPTHLHKTMSFAAFDAGKDVILEKPMAINSKEAALIAAEAEKTGRTLTVYQPHRLNADFQHIRKIVDSGRIGRLTAVQRSSFSYARRNDWQSQVKFGGGMLNNYGAHYIDQILQLIGYDITRLFCTLQLVATMGDADDVVKVTLCTASGVFADLQISQAAPSRPYEFIVWGTHGTIEQVGATLKVRSFDPAALPPKSLDTSLMSANRKYPTDKLPIVEELIPIDKSLAIDLYADFVAAVREHRAPYVPPTETLAVMNLIDKCRADAGIPCDMR